MRRLNAVRNRKQTLKVLKELDAFPKVPENYQQTSASGGSGEYVRKILLKHALLRAVATKIYYRPYACRSVNFHNPCAEIPTLQFWPESSRFQ